MTPTTTPAQPALEDFEVRKLAAIGAVSTSSRLVKRHPIEYRRELENQFVRGFRAAESRLHAQVAALTAAPGVQAITKTHDLLSTMIGMFLGFKDKIGYKPGSVIDKTVAEAVEHLKDWPYPETAAPKAQPAPAADPCPGCRPGIVCRTPKCGRLAARAAGAVVGAVRVCPECDIAGCRHLRAAPAPAAGAVAGPTVDMPSPWFAAPYSGYDTQYWTIKRRNPAWRGGTEIGMNGNGNPRRFKTEAAAQKVADELNAAAPTPAAQQGDARASFIRWHMDYLRTDEMLAAHVWDNEHTVSQAWRAALAHKEGK